MSMPAKCLTCDHDWEGSPGEKEGYPQGVIEIVGGSV